MMTNSLMRHSVKASVALLLLSSTSAFAQSGPWQLSETSGQVSVGREGVTKVALRGQKLRANDTIRTGPRGKAVITRGEQYMVVASDSHIRLANPKVDGVMTQVFNYLGNVLFKIDKRKTSHFSVKTPYLAAVVKGTTFNISVGAEGTTVQVTEGAVQVSTLDGGAMELLRPGMIGQVRGADPFSMLIMGDTTRRIISPNRPVTSPKPVATKKTVSTTSTPSVAPQAIVEKSPTNVANSIANTPVQLAIVTDGLIENQSSGSRPSQNQANTEQAAPQIDAQLASEIKDSRGITAAVNSASDGMNTSNGNIIDSGQSDNAQDGISTAMALTASVSPPAVVAQPIVNAPVEMSMMTDGLIDGQSRGDNGKDNGADVAEPKDNGKDSGADTAEPKDNGKDSGADMAEPKDNGKDSGADMAEPKDNGKDSGADMAEPKDNGKDSGADMAEPKDNGKDSGADMAEPKDNGKDSGADTAEPKDNGKDSGADMAEPKDNGKDSGADMAEPKDNGKDSGADMAEPKDNGKDSGADMAEPKDNGKDSGADMAEPNSKRKDKSDRKR